MSDVKGMESPKVELPAASASPPAPPVAPAKPATPPASEAKAAEAPPAPSKPADPPAAPAKPAEVKVPESGTPDAKAASPAKPAAPHVPEAKPAEHKPAPSKPAEAVKAPDPKPVPVAAAAAAPAAGTVGVRAPVARTDQQNLTITISTRAVALIVGGLVMSVIVLFGAIIFVLVRLNDRDPLRHIVDQVPGMDRGQVARLPAAAAAPTEAAPAAAAEAPEKVDIGVNFKSDYGGKAGALPGAWTAFRGPKYDNIVGEVNLASHWPKGGPPVKWTIPDLAEGYSGPAALGGRVYLQDYDDKKKEESLRCFSLEDGKEIWRRSYPLKIVNNHGFTRTVPAVTEKYVVSMGSKCHVLCVDAQTGDMKWGIDLMKDYGSKLPDWYTAQCPIIDGTTAVLAPGGKDVLMMGVDCETGKVVWKTPNPKALQMSHSSITPMTLKGRKMYVYCAEWGKMVGVSAGPEGIGDVLWETTCLDKQVIAPSPVILEDGYIFMTAGYKGGSSLLQVTEEGGKFQAKVLWKLDEVEGLSCEQQTPIYYNKHVFALLPDSSGARKQQLVCMDPYDKGKITWESGKEKRFGQYEPILLADGKFYVLSKDCTLTLVKANTQKYEELGQCKLLQGHDAWAPIALVGDRMLIRDSKVMICIDVGKSIE